MSEQQNLELVRRGYEAFGRGDLNTLLSLFDDNIEWSTPGPAELPIAGRRRGREAVAEFFKRLDELIEVQRFEPREFIAQSDRVVVFGQDTSRVRATGKVIEGEWAHTFKVRNDKIVVFQEYADTAPLVVELRLAQTRA